MENFKEMMPEEFYNIVKKENEVLKHNKQTLDLQISNIKGFLSKLGASNTYYDNKELYKYINKSDSNNKIINAFKAVFGEDIFTNMSDEMKDDFKSLYKDVIGKKYGYEISLPNSFEDFVDSFINCIKLSNSSSIFSIDKEKYKSFVSGVLNTLNHYYNRKIVISEKVGNVINLYNTYIDAYEKKKTINISDKLSNDIDNAFIYDKRTLLLLDEKTNEKHEITYNKIFKYFISINNYEVKEEEHKKSINKKANKYYKKLKRARDITDSLYPSFEDEDFKPIMYNLLDIINGNIINEQSACLSAITSMQIVKYYKDNAKKENVKSI